MRITKGDIKKNLLAKRGIFKEFRIKSIGIFGSYVRSEQKEDSDVDFLVEFEDIAFDKNYRGYFNNYMDLLFYLEKTFGKKIDLLTVEEISPRIRPYVFKEVEYIEAA